MEKNRFESAAETTLENLAELIETADKEGVLEVECTSGVLTITLPTKQQYVINRHRVTQQLWWSSPKSGAKYFALQEDGSWLDKEHQELQQLLFAELQLLSGIKVA